MADDDKHPLDAAYERYADGKIMRRDMIRLLIDAVKELQAAPERQAEAMLEYVNAGIAQRETALKPKRGGWPKGRSRKPHGEINGHSLDTIPVGVES